jgi:hypothetical protein
MQEIFFLVFLLMNTCRKKMQRKTISFFYLDEHKQEIQMGSLLFRTFSHVFPGPKASQMRLFVRRWCCAADLSSIFCMCLSGELYCSALRGIYLVMLGSSKVSVESCSWSSTIMLWRITKVCQDATGLGSGRKMLPKTYPPHYAGQSGLGQRVNFLDRTQTRLINNWAWVGAGLVISGLTRFYLHDTMRRKKTSFINLDWQSVPQTHQVLCLDKSSLAHIQEPPM